MDLWKMKLAAFLHDPPEKCTDIGRHEQIRDAYMTAMGLNVSTMHENDRRELNRIIRAVDHFAAATDRFAFPKGECASSFTGMPGQTFIHPLCSKDYEMASLRSSNEYSTWLGDALGGIPSNDARTAFFLLWRCWKENAILTASSAEALALFPADTRIPDHTIWNHNAFASALVPCVKGDTVRPALLMFQMGPVQEFIAQARSTRDLWSGSYMLSWLMAHAMKAVADEVGPDAVIFPNLRGNGIFDTLHKDDIYGVMYKNEDKRGGSDTLWTRMLRSRNEQGDSVAKWLLTPTLPNRFLAVVPEEKAQQLAEAAETAIHVELAAMGDAVWSFLSRKANDWKLGDVTGWKARWDSQLAAFPQIAWAIQPWLEREECLRQFKALPINRSVAAGERTPYQQLADTLKLAEEYLPSKDGRFYDADGKLNNAGILWMAHYALVDAKLAARRNTREFAAWTDPFLNSHADAPGVVKDSLSGKEEVIGSEAFWTELRKEGSETGAYFSKAAGHRYGAMNLIKRLWCRARQVPYLADKLGLTPDAFERNIGFESVQAVAEKNDLGGHYVAVLAMDGDEMGKWVSGTRTPLLLNQLSENARTYLKPILEAHGLSGLRRLLTPSYHLQFSEALANYAVSVAREVVEAHNGQLVYAGGDDVLAMLPADKAIACAKALRAFFCGKEPENPGRYPLSVVQDGFVKGASSMPLILPGTSCSVSMGMAVGHFKAPLQMLVREAQAAEHRAKHQYGRDALAFSIYKRSGEIMQWGCKWQGKALPLMETLTALYGVRQGERGKLSDGFPYALMRLLAPYDLCGGEAAISVEELVKVIEAELSVVISRQGSELQKSDVERLTAVCHAWLKDCAERDCLGDFIQPFLTETFVNRAPGE